MVTFPNLQEEDMSEENINQSEETSPRNNMSSSEDENIMPYTFPSGDGFFTRRHNSPSSDSDDIGGRDAGLDALRETMGVEERILSRIRNA